MLNSFLVKYRTVKENHNNESLSFSFFLMLPGFSAWIVLVIVSLFLFFLQSSRSVFIFFFSLVLPSIQVAFFDLKSQLFSAQWTYYLHFYFLCCLSFHHPKRAFLLKIMLLEFYYEHMGTPGSIFHFPISFSLTILIPLLFFSTIRKYFSDRLGHISAFCGMLSAAPCLHWLTFGNIISIWKQLMFSDSSVL